jgi:hypothetical protein
VSWLRASRKVVDPAGVRWDVYITRIAVGEPGQLYQSDMPHAGGYGGGMAGGGFWLIDLVLTAGSELARLATRLLLMLPFGIVRSRFGIRWRIEAISDVPHEVTRVWQVEGKPGRVLLDEIARGLALGTVPEPAGATYLGERDR